jgi:hypothetical protein
MLLEHYVRISKVLEEKHTKIFLPCSKKLNYILQREADVSLTDIM